MTWLDALWQVIGSLTGATPSAFSGLLLIAALAAAVLLLLRRTAADRPAHSGLALRTRANSAGVPRHRDPDAPGRTRPRGPTARPAAAAV
ncbi:DUF6412 domain-containing protein [Actinoplanes solisilvae]|uniref:DUF6412 domain-containing protein n=1 Tax=Actinoplanes solisilvae TaxID=2486853 RepID=UPI001F0BCD94|nr:DUF6412 domain-containing protein [Actinoplanes solisilvae]